MATDTTIRIRTKATGKREVDDLTKTINSAYSRGRLGIAAFNEAPANGRKVVKEMDTGAKDW